MTKYHVVTIINTLYRRCISRKMQIIWSIRGQDQHKSRYRNIFWHYNPIKVQTLQKNHIRFKIYPFFTIFDIMWSIICFTKRNVLVSKKKSLRSKEIIGEVIIEYHKKRIEIIFKNKTKKWNLRTISIQSTCCWLKATMKSYTDSIHVASISMYRWKKRNQIDENKDLKFHFNSKVQVFSRK